ncbi:MAG TPA: hypothetical protein VMG12_19685 [Polyangiaceae bacterium]|nr:hypothetical protein [Polyangiaceae bacterium]
MDQLSAFLDVLQKVISVLGPVLTALGMLFPRARNWLTERGKQARHVPSKDGNQTTTEDADSQRRETASFARRIARRARERHAFMELGFALLLGAIYSVILGDALLDSSAAIGDPLQELMKAGVLSLVVVALLATAWLQKQLEFANGMLAITAMLVSLLSSRAVTNPEASEAYTLSILLGLLAVSTAALTFLFGNPFAPGRESAGRTKLWAGGVILLLGLSAAVIGRGKVRALETDPRLPTLYTAAVEDLARAANALPIDQRKLLYALASEVHLEANYRGQHEALESRVRQDKALLTQLAASSEPMSSDYAARLSALQLTALQYDLLDSVRQRQSSLAPSDRTAYMLARLGWVHPLGSRAGEKRAAMSLPSPLADKRFELVNIARVNHALGLWAPRRQDGTAGNKDRSLFEYSGFTPQRNDDLFPALPLVPGLVELQTQLSWPPEAEAWIAREEYKALGLIGYPELAPLSQAYDDLPDGERAAIRELLAASQDAELRLATLVNVGQAFGVLTEAGLPAPGLAGDERCAAISKATSRSSLYTIATKLERANALVDLADDSARAFVQLADDKLDADQRRRLAELLKTGDGVSVQPLFSNAALGWVGKVKHALVEQKRTALFTVLAKPVLSGVQMILEQSSAPPGEQGKAARGALPTQPVRDFIALSTAERESVLLRLAKELYGAGGEFALYPPEQIVYQMRTKDARLAIAAAGVFTLPFFALAVLTGTFIARRLRAHYRQRVLLDRECEDVRSGGNTRGAHVLGTLLKHRGREQVLRSLDALGQRGWTTTAIAGRRGIGKSRALFELLSHRDVDEASHRDAPEARVSIWVSAPTEFDEREFVVTMLEQLAEGVEHTVAKVLGAEPLSVRAAEARLAVATAAVFSIGLAAVWALAGASFPQADPMTRTLMLLPAATSTLLGALFYILHIVRLQPINLEPWLERDRSYQVATVWLYREARRVRASIGQLRINSWRPTFIFNSLLIAGLSGAGVALLVAALDIGGDADIITSFIGTLFLVLIGRLLRGGGEQLASSVNGFMSVVSAYRNFARTVVKRLEEGALGGAPGVGRVVVAVDELDKMPIDQVRVFVRRIKSVFEVPGVYYYVSISEDALAQLYLSEAKGKDEFDSAFDHIVQIAPLEVTDAAAAVEEFFQKISFEVGDRRMPVALAALSLGVPRDLLRRTDEATTTWSAQRESAHLIRAVRTRQVRLAHQEGVLSRQEVNLLSGEALPVEATAGDYVCGGSPISEVAGGGSPGKRPRVWIMAWVYAALEVAVTGLDEHEWLTRAEQLRIIGYRAAIDPLDELTADIRAYREQTRSTGSAGAAVA